MTDNRCPFADGRNGLTCIEVERLEFMKGTGSYTSETPELARKYKEICRTIKHANCGNLAKNNTYLEMMGVAK